MLQICLIRAFLSGGLWLHTTEEVHAISVSSKPKASLVARSLANTNERITTLQHWSVELNLLDRYLLSQLDGTHSIEHLLVLLGNAVAQRPELQPFRNADVRELLKSRLTHFVRLALLLK